MTAPNLTMNRVIHGAVRRDLDRLATALGQLRDGDTARAQALARAYENLRTELTHHHEGEDTYIFPMLGSVGVDQGLLDAMESEHHAMAEALTETAAAMSTVARSGSAADAAAAQASVVRTREVVERHLQHEENELEPQLAPHVESPEWKAVEKKLRSQPLGVAGRFFAWLTDGMSDEHRAFLKKTVPSPVVTVLAKTFGRRYYKDVAPTWRS
ncbi:hemerythrin domain-containing protein [Blastococcus haudaquaticus]|uniref:Hemerythrin HHE cation binding domain-containing protein n=1 Tax=Blastococcus haudaquaticus TaxID=1938745 RepID=A0A286GU68_9ACTN|nr:hemerythrin domain-containing protein [Blastococcus haudaquaticus]SOD98629.1 Hemerythrin HHE cation binding domain-containing protein [Blastococcus haudaquaticus]